MFRTTALYYSNNNDWLFTGGNAIQAVISTADGYSHEQTAVVCALYQAKPWQETRYVSQCLSMYSV